MENRNVHLGIHQGIKAHLITVLSSSSKVRLSEYNFVRDCSAEPGKDIPCLQTVSGSESGRE